MALLVGFVLAFICLIIYLSYFLRSRTKRTDELSNWARSQGLEYYYSQEFDVSQRCAAFICLTTGHNRCAYNFMTGRLGKQEICAFDYRFETYPIENRFHKREYKFSAVVVETGMPLKPLLIRSKYSFDKLANSIGFHDICLESTEFSNKFYVKSPDRRWAYDILNQEVMDFLLSSPIYYLEFCGTQIIAYRESQFAAAEFEAALKLVTGIIDRLSASLVKELNEIK